MSEDRRNNSPLCITTDPWTDGLKRDYPSIYIRLENWLNALARASGRERKPETPAAMSGNNLLSVMRNSEGSKYKGMSLSEINDLRNKHDFERLINGSVTIEELQKERGITRYYGIMQSLNKTFSRSTPEEHERFIAWRAEQMKGPGRGQSKKVKKSRKMKM